MLRIACNKWLHAINVRPSSGCALLCRTSWQAHGIALHKCLWYKTNTITYASIHHRRNWFTLERWPDATNDNINTSVIHFAHGICLCMSVNLTASCAFYVRHLCASMWCDEIGIRRPIRILFSGAPGSKGAYVDAVCVWVQSDRQSKCNFRRFTIKSTSCCIALPMRTEINKSDGSCTICVHVCL